MKKKKWIDYEALEEKALKWFYNQFDWQQAEQITNLYMEEFDMKIADVRLVDKKGGKNVSSGRNVSR